MIPNIRFGAVTAQFIDFGAMEHKLDFHPEQVAQLQTIASKTSSDALTTKKIFIIHYTLV